ncbi:high frequency lysogenization protein HflD [Alcanivorax sp. JB21]|uniref:high frequency lysogenization protein HflD n=1 Tax=Alcanivorax limicola TaxID=2874102 RepID=UPI001CC0B72C|nr:high frequency lysogenization protein HflD [Alcanivorax limicola]MBZ2187809.1 high frequency lysogenization protein HflD [Alcanivorax limicola]
MNRPEDLHQVIALAAIFQAGQIADRIASTGECPNDQLRTLLSGTMNLAPASYEDVYPALGDLRPGFSMLRDALSGKQSRDKVRPVGYALALMHLSGRLRKDDSLMTILRNRLEALDAQRAHFPDLVTDEFCHRLAGIYVDTLGTLKFRIKVQGEPTHLRNEDNAARIRATFLTGVRAGFLWHQAGGRRWHLVFRRARLLAAVDAVLKQSLH